MPVLDLSQATTISTIVIDALEEAGYNDSTETIPGLIKAVLAYAMDEDKLLDAAANLLADGFDDEF